MQSILPHCLAGLAADAQDLIGGRCTGVIATLSFVSRVLPDDLKFCHPSATKPEQMVQAMAQHELGLSEHRFPNHWKSAISAAISTAVGAFIPIIPFFFMSGIEAVIASFAVSIVAHFAVGAVKSLITIRSWWASGLEMTIVGVIEAVVTYALGLAFGAMA